MSEHMVMCYHCHGEFRPILSKIRLVCNECYEKQKQELISEFLEDLDKLEVEDATNQHNRTYEAIEVSDIDILRKKWKNYDTQ